MGDATMTLSVFQVFSGDKTIYTKEEDHRHLDNFLKAGLQFIF